MSMQYTPNNAIPTSPLYISCIVNIKHKARSWGISSQNSDLDYTRISSQIRVHGAFGAYSEVEKTWHIEFYMWGKYFGSEPFPFPFPSTTTATLISATNPAPVPTGPRAMNSTPVPNPYPPMYIPGPPQTPIINIINTGRFSPAPAPGSGSRANLSQYQNQYQHHQGSSPASGLRNGFTIRGIAAGGSPRYSNMGQAYNNRPMRGRGTDESRGTVVSKGGEGGGPRLEDSRGGGGQDLENSRGGGQRNGRGAVYAARRQLKIARRTGGRN